jgi:type IV pilus assembly protein PilW
MKYHSSNGNNPWRQGGFTMVELMIALLIGLFLLGGLFTMLQNNKKTFTSQSKLAQLQDTERMAMSIMTDVIQESGYFTDPTIHTATSTMAALSGLPAGGTMAVGQAMTGSYSATAPGDTITVRFATANNDGILNCAGTSNTTGNAPPATFTFVNTFSVVANANPMLSQLGCTREDGTFYPLVYGVTNLSVLYGVNTSGSGNNVDTYMTATQVAANWGNVISVHIALTFENPLYTGPNLGQPQIFLIQRQISVMNRIGL